jgi:hypothetical protein
MRRLLALGAALFVAMAQPASAQTPQAYPSRPVTWVVPFSAGSVYDNTARIIGTQLVRQAQNNFGNLGDISPGKLRALIVGETARFKTLVERSGVSVE